MRLCKGDGANYSRPRSGWKERLICFRRTAAGSLLLFPLVAVCVLTGAAKAATSYVATTGSDSNSGSVDAPFGSIQRAVQAARPGDTIVVKDGVYGPPASCRDPSGDMEVTIDNAGTADAPILLKAEHRWRAILDPANRCHSVIDFGPHSAYWIVEGFNIRNGYFSGIWSNSGGGKHIAIRGNHIYNIGNHPVTRVVRGNAIGEAGIFTDKTSVFTVVGNVIHDVGRTNVFKNSLDHGIYSFGTMDIIDNVFYNARYGWHIAVAEGFSGVIEGNAFYGPNLYTAEERKGQISFWHLSGGKVIVRNNLFYGSNGDPLNLSNVLPAPGTVTADANNRYEMGPTRTEAFKSREPRTHLRAGAPQLPLDLKDLQRNRAEVILLQMFLFRHNYLKDGPDGRFSPETEAVLTQFQRDHQLTPTGLPDRDTRVVINKMLLESVSLS